MSSVGNCKHFYKRIVGRTDGTYNVLRNCVQFLLSIGLLMYLCGKFRIF